MKQKKIFIALIMVCIGVFVLYTQFFKDSELEKNYYQERVIQTENGSTFTVRVADTEPLRIKGLSGTQDLLEDKGMWFVFPENGYYGIWMKDMLIPIDIIWLDENLVIIHREINVLPESYPTIFGSSQESRYVLEISADTADKKGLLIGSEIIIQQ